MSYSITINDVEDIRETFLDMFEEERFVIDKTGVKMVEIPSVQFLANESVIFGDVDIDYVRREIEWYVSQDLNVNSIEPPVPKIWQEVADSDGFINSNYGWCVFSEENHFQFNNCLSELEKNVNSRRAVMIYTRPSIQEEFNKNGMSDFICTNAVQYLIRENELIACVSMRSNDAIFGYTSDWGWQVWVRDKLYNELLKTYPNLKKGEIVWNAVSLHIYERHFYLLEYFQETGTARVAKRVAKKFVEELKKNGK